MASASCCPPTLPYCGTLEVDPLVMPTSQLLRHLYSLDVSSPGFSRYLYHLIQSDREDHYLLDLKGPDLTQLVDFLDKVRVLPRASIQFSSRFHRPSTSSRPLTMFPDCAYTSCKPSADTTGSCRLRTLFLVGSSELATTQLPLEVLPMYGKGSTTTPKCVSNVRGSP